MKRHLAKLDNIRKIGKICLTFISHFKFAYSPNIKLNVLLNRPVRNGPFKVQTFSRQCNSKFGHSITYYTEVSDWNIQIRNYLEGGVQYSSENYWACYNSIFKISSAAAQAQLTCSLIKVLLRAASCIILLNFLAPTQEEFCLWGSIRSLASIKLTCRLVEMVSDVNVSVVIHNKSWDFQTHDDRIFIEPGVQTRKWPTICKTFVSRESDRHKVNWFNMGVWEGEITTLDATNAQLR